MEKDSVFLSDKVIVFCVLFAAFASLFSLSANSVALYLAIPCAFLLSFKKYGLLRVSKTFKIITMLYFWVFVSYFWAINKSVALSELNVCLGAIMLCYIFSVNAKRTKLLPWLYLSYIVLYLSAWYYASTHILVDMTSIGAEGERLNDQSLNANTMAYYTFYVSFALFVLGEIVQSPFFQKVLKWLFLLMIPVSFLVALFTASRQVLFIQAPLIAVLLYIRYLRNKPTHRKVIFIIISICVCAFFVSDLLDIYSNSYLYTRSSENVKDDIRRYLMEDAFNVGLDNFFTGVGTGCYCIVSRYGGFSHTTYIELFANTGILGSLIFIWAILNFLMTQLRRYKSTNDLLFLLFLIFGLFFAFDNFFYVFYSSVWLLGIFLLVAAHSDQHYYSNYS